MDMNMILFDLYLIYYYFLLREIIKRREKGFYWLLEMIGRVVLIKFGIFICLLGYMSNGEELNYI